MDWLTGNGFFVIVLLLCVGMHLFHGHGGHGDGDGHTGGDTEGHDDHNKTTDEDASTPRHRH